jgi:two-component system CheB/CheR fusion protein
VTSELSRAAASLADLSHVLESGEQSAERLRRAAEQVRALLRSDVCAVATAVDELAPPLVVVPEPGSEELARLEREARALLDVVGEAAHRAPPLRRSGERPRLAVPLIAIGRVAGIVLVERAEGEYGDRDLQLLAVVASQLGAYLAVLQARETQRRSERAVSELLAATRAQEERRIHFLNVLSHELRNPLAPLRNAVYVLARAEPGADSARRARAIIGRQVEHLARLLDDLLDAARISTGKVHLRRSLLDLADVVRRTVDDHRSVFEARSVELRLEASREPLWLDGDETRIAQVVGNLLANAQKFTSAGGHVAVTVRRDAAATAIVQVRDDGVGISPETLARVFDEFAQGDETLHRSHEGLGLGLTLARGLVELHGGTIAARSEGVGRGAEFVVRLPLAAAAPRPGPARAPASAARPATPRRILVVDDSEDAAEALRDVLRLAGHEVELALDGPAGVALARAWRPDVVLCDVGMPGMTGYDVARALRADPALAGTLVVALTGFGTAEDQQRAQDAGFDRHIVKPVALAALERLLEDAGAIPQPHAGRAPA